MVQLDNLIGIIFHYLINMNYIKMSGIFLLKIILYMSTLISLEEHTLLMMNFHLWHAELLYPKYNNFNKTTFLEKIKCGVGMMIDRDEAEKR